MYHGHPFVIVDNSKDQPNCFRYANIGFSDLIDFFEAVFVQLEPTLKRYIEKFGAIVVSTSFNSMFTVNGCLKYPFVHCAGAHPVYSFDKDLLHELYSDIIVQPVLSARDEFRLMKNTAELYHIDRFVVNIASMELLDRYVEPRLFH